MQVALRSRVVRVRSSRRLVRGVCAAEGVLDVAQEDADVEGGGDAGVARRLRTDSVLAGDSRLGGEAGDEAPGGVRSTGLLELVADKGSVVRAAVATPTTRWTAGGRGRWRGGRTSG